MTSYIVDAVGILILMLVEAVLIMNCRKKNKQ